MGAKVTRTDFEWDNYTEEPHASRRKEILAKYPEIKKLMGYDPNLKYIVFFMVLVQLFMCHLMQNASWATIILAAYCFGGVINHAMSLAIHEIAHNLAFGHQRPLYNRLLGIFGNVVIGIPQSVTFKRYHLEHHRYQGDEKLDQDLPTRLEAKLFCNTVTKVVWVILQPFFYGIRPLLMRPLPPTLLEGLNMVVQVAFDCAIVYFFGLKSLAYLIGGSLLAMGLHPVAGHFISEHYMFKQGHETYSYYGPLNMLTFNVGYHMEHHDFPYIPGCRLPKVREIAPEFYNALPYHTSWVKVIYDFICDPAIGPYARVKRLSKHNNGNNGTKKE